MHLALVRNPPATAGASGLARCSQAALAGPRASASGPRNECRDAAPSRLPQVGRLPPLLAAVRSSSVLAGLPCAHHLGNVGSSASALANALANRTPESVDASWIAPVQLSECLGFCATALLCTRLVPPVRATSRVDESTLVRGVFAVRRRSRGCMLLARANESPATLCRRPGL